MFSQAKWYRLILRNYSCLFLLNHLDSSCTILISKSANNLIENEFQKMIESLCNIISKFIEVCIEFGHRFTDYKPKNIDDQTVVKS